MNWDDWIGRLMSFIFFLFFLNASNELRCTIELDNHYLKFHADKKRRLEERGEKCCKTAPEAYDGAVELLEELYCPCIPSFFFFLSRLLTLP
jgi:hypothetical protein